MNYFDILFFSNIFFLEYYTNYGFSNLLEKYFLINLPFFIVVYLLAFLEKNEISIKVYEVYNICNIYFNFVKYLEFIIIKLLQQQV